MGGGRKWKKTLGLEIGKKNTTTTTTTLGGGIELFSLKPCPFGRLQERGLEKSEATTIPEAVFGGLSFLGMLAVPF